MPSRRHSLQTESRWRPILSVIRDPLSVISKDRSDAPLFGGAAAVVRQRGDVLDGLDGQTGGLQGGNGRLAAGAGALDADLDLLEAELGGPLGGSLGCPLGG